jgi:hypothetical protein
VRRPETLEPREWVALQAAIAGDAGG